MISSLRRNFVCLLVLAALPCLLAAQQPSHTTEAPGMIEGPQAPGAAPPAKAAEPEVMTNDSVIRMHQAGLSDAIILQTVTSQPGVYKTGPNDLIALKQAGISDEVLYAMGTKARHPMVTRVEEPVEAAPVTDIGVYYKDDHGQWQPMESEKVHTKTSGWVKNALSQGIIKQDNNGVVNGPEAKLVLHRPVEFLIHTADGVEGTEYTLLLFRLNGKERQFRVLTGGVFHSESGAQHDEVEIHPKRIASHTWTFTLTRENAGGGEYGILPPGTGNITNGGKIYTFAIVE
jgi:hypothetical protein